LTGQGAAEAVGVFVAEQGARRSDDVEQQVRRGDSGAGHAQQVELNGKQEHRAGDADRCSEDGDEQTGSECEQGDGQAHGADLRRAGVRGQVRPARWWAAAEEFLLKIEGDKRQGAYIDPGAGRLTFGEFVETWLASQTFDVSTRNSVTWRLGLCTTQAEQDPGRPAGAQRPAPRRRAPRPLRAGGGDPAVAHPVRRADDGPVALDRRGRPTDAAKPVQRPDLEPPRKAAGIVKPTRRGLQTDSSASTL
jgi:hypothetical protein